MKNTDLEEYEESKQSVFFKECNNVTNQLKIE